MRIVTILAIAICCLALVVPMASAASRPGGMTPVEVGLGHSGGIAAPVLGAPGHRQMQPYLGLTATPMLMAAGFGALEGTIKDPEGLTRGNTEVDWGYTNADGWHFGGTTTTDYLGHFSFPEVTATTAGGVQAWFTKDGHRYSLWREPLTFTEATTTTVDFAPGRAGLNATRGGPWKTWQRPRVVFAESGVDGAWTDFAFDTRGSETMFGAAMPGNADYACIYFWANEATEWMRPPGQGISVASGQLLDWERAYVHQDDALRCYVTSPFWHSCRPGDTVKMALQNWPAGRKAAFLGQPDAPSGPVTTFGDRKWTSTAKTAHTLSFRIPGTAKPGYGYYINALRTDDSRSSLQLQEYVQLATLKKYYLSGRLRMTGIVPTQGHWGAQAGKNKRVIIYAKYSRAGVPTKWDPTGQGWHKVAEATCNGQGRFYAGIPPTKPSAWYVARYAGDDWYWGAFTNVVSVPR